MVVSGDEYGRTQNGNNPWNLNTIGMWNNWAMLASNAPTQLPVDPDDPEAYSYYDVAGVCDSELDVNPMFRFAQYVTRLRELDPTLRQKAWGRQARQRQRQLPVLPARPEGPARPDRPAGDRADQRYRHRRHRPPDDGEHVHQAGGLRCRTSASWSVPSRT